MDGHMYMDMSKLRPRNIDVMNHNGLLLKNENDTINHNIRPLRNRSPIPMEKVISDNLKYPPWENRYKK